MKRATVIYGAVLVLLMAASWVQWTADEPLDLEGKVVVLQGDADAITAVRWVSDESEATVSRKSDDLGTFYWVDYTRWTEKTLPADRSADDTGDADAPPEKERVSSRSEFKSSAKAEALMASLSPLAARRSLTVTDDEKLEALGLDVVTTRIEIDRSGSTEVLEIGAEAYGTRDYYARHVSSGRIYLFERDLVQPLKYARTRLPDRTLFGHQRADIKTAKVTVGQASQTWNQHHADDQGKARWATSQDPEAVAEQATTWLDKFLKLKGTKYADPNDPPPDLQARFSVELSTSDEATVVDVVQVGADGDWYARSQHTRGLIKLVRSGAVALSEDGSALVAEAKK